MSPRKYRGLRVDNGEWVKGWYVVEGCHEPKPHFIVEVNGRWNQVIPETVGQYTGEKDRNGVEIYGDDIARFNHHGKRLTGEVFQSATGEWTISAGTVGESADLYYGRVKKDIEVIGNRHQNPELLEARDV